MSNLNCPCCGQQLKEWNFSWKCENCSMQINKKISGKLITPMVIQQLCQNQRTPVLTGFFSKSNKPFTASLVIQGNRIAFEFPSDKSSATGDSTKTTSNQVGIRVESPSSGVVVLSILGSVNFKCAANFGLIPSRLAECMGVIVAGRYLLHNQYDKHIVINANNRDFVEYALRETIPNRKESRFLVEHMWSVLDKFDSWEIKYDHQKKRSLKGGAVQGTFPKGLFPWLKVDIEKQGEYTQIRLPDDPAVIANFRASIRTAQGEGCKYAVPAGAEKVVRAWVAMVKG